MRFKKDAIDRRSGWSKVLFAVVFVIFFIYACSLILPFVWGGISSLKTPHEYYADPFKLPEIPQWQNYADAVKNLAFHGVTLPEMVWNSIWFSVGSIVINLFFTSLTAYILSKYNFKGKSFLYSLNLVVLFLPTYGSFASTFRLYYQTGMANSYWILLSATGGFSFNMMLLYAYFKNISSSYSEAAFIDGAGHFKVFWKIMLPQARPMVMALFLLGFIGKWNDYMTPMLYLEEKLTLATGLFRYQEIAMRYGEYPMLFAGLFISMIPIVILFAFFANVMMNNMSLGGLKE